MIPIIRIRDEKGNVFDIPAIKGKDGVGMGNITASDVKCADGKTVEVQLAELWQSYASTDEKLESVGALEYFKNINPDTTGYNTLLEYMASRYNEHPVIFGYASGFSDMPDGVDGGQAVINLCGGILTVEIKTRTAAYHRGTNSLTSWTDEWCAGITDKGGTINGVLTVNERVRATSFMVTPEGYGTPIEAGQFIDMHMPGSAADHDARVSIDGKGGFFVDSMDVWLSRSCSTGNVNELTDGVWKIDANITNAPIAAACVVYHKRWDANFKTQLAICSDGTLRYRVMTSGAWSAWRTVSYN